jgi:xylulose-5-phosphate/fructose-6-phosphate phosphoketolase
VVFAFHGYRWVIHSVIHGRPGETRFHVRGYMNEGSTTTPFDMVVVNRMSRFHLAMDALSYVPRLRSKTSDVIDRYNRKLQEHQAYTRQNLEDMPEIANWRWTADFSEPSGEPPLARPSGRQGFSDA